MDTFSYLLSIQSAYPDFIKDVNGNMLHLHDGASIEVNLSPSQLDALRQVEYLSDIDRLNSDVSRIRLHALLQKMYGDSEERVKSNLVEISWLPQTVNKKVLITRVNGVHEKLQIVSDELERLPKKFKKFVVKLSGSFNWRTIADSSELSPHAYGIAIDINKKYANYWKWDENKAGGVSYRNRIPYEIIRIFERQGFVWGGRWLSYDTMHFEYRPEFIVDRKKRVLFLSRGGLKYGSEMQLLRLIENIDQSKHELHLITDDKNSEVYPVFAQHSYALPAWRKIKNIFSRYKAARQLLDYAKQHHIDLIHCSYQWLYPYARYIGSRLNIPVILHVRRPNNRLGVVRDYAAAEAIICISKRIRQEFLDAGVDVGRLFLIPDVISNNFQVDTAKSALKIRYGLHKKFIVAIIGRIYNNKKHDLFIALANMLSQFESDIDFLIVGKVDDEAYYQQLKTKVAASHANITFTGHVEDMASIFNAIDILVTFSGGSVMYEAMAWGKVVVSVGFVKHNTSEFLKHRETAFVIENNALEDVSDTIIEVLADAGLSQAIGQRASACIREKLQPATLAKQVEVIYEHMTSKNRHQS